jgi:hypothetical protein
MSEHVRRSLAEPVIVARDAERGLLSGFLDPIGASADASYGAVFGDTYIKVGGLTYVTAAQGKQIVEQLHAKM